MTLPVVVGCTSAVCQSVREAVLFASDADNAASLDWQTPPNGIISPQRVWLITMQKQLEGTLKHINEQCR